MNVGNSSLTHEPWVSSGLATPATAFEEVVNSFEPPSETAASRSVIDTLKFEVDVTQLSSVENKVALSFTDFVAYKDLLQELRRLQLLEAGWDSYDATAPDESAIRRARVSLAFFLSAGLFPSKLVPSAEGGVGIVFARGDRYADVEFFNDGETLAVRYQGNNAPEVWVAENDDETVSLLSTFFGPTEG